MELQKNAGKKEPEFFGARPAGIGVVIQEKINLTRNVFSCKVLSLPAHEYGGKNIMMSLTALRLFGPRQKKYPSQKPIIVSDVVLSKKAQAKVDAMKNAEPGPKT